LIHEFDTPNNGIMSLNEYNPVGDAIASGTGNKFAIWQPSVQEDNSLQPTGVMRQLKAERIPEAMVNVLRGVARAPRRTHNTDDEDEEDQSAPKKKTRGNCNTKSKPKAKGGNRKGKKK